MKDSNIKILSGLEATKILGGQGAVAEQNRDVPLICTRCIICGEEIPSYTKVCNNCKKAVMKVRSDIGC